MPSDITFPPQGSSADRAAFVDPSSSSLFKELWPRLDKTFKDFICIELLGWNEATAPINVVLSSSEFFSRKKFVLLLTEKKKIIRQRCTFLLGISFL